MIPEFRRDGKLPAGRHPTDWPEFEERFGQTPRRKQMLTGLRRATRLLKLAGCRLIYVDGSFATSKTEPGDFDACWDITGVKPDALPPIFFNFADGRAAQKAQFGGEFFPAQLPESRTGMDWLEFFQRDREGKPKGIIALALESVP